MSSDSDLHERMLAMAGSLLQATKAGKISWQLTDAENKYIYAGTSSSVTIEFHPNSFESDTTSLSLLNKRGVVVDSLETEIYHVDDDWEPAEWNDVLEGLYHAARRVAHNVDEALDSLMSDIERGTPSRSLKKAANPRDSDPWATDSPGGYSDEPPF